MSARNKDKMSPLSTLIDDRLQDLGLSETEFLSRLGYKNMQKGRERLASIRRSERSGLKGIRYHEKQIAEILQVDRETVQKAINESWAVRQRKIEEAYAAAFKPHAVLKTKRETPAQITFWAMTGGDRRWRMRKFEEGSNPVTYVDQVLKNLPEKVVFFGPVLGFYVNYAPDRCIEYDREGNPVAEYDKAKWILYGSAEGFENLFS